MFLPELKRGQTLADAYAESRRNGIFPVLALPHKHSFSFSASEGYSYRDIQMYFLSELYFKEGEVVAFSSPLAYPPYSPTVHIPGKQVLELFRSCFAIIKSHEQGVRFEHSPKISLN